MAASLIFGHDFTVGYAAVAGSVAAATLSPYNSASQSGSGLDLSTDYAGADVAAHADIKTAIELGYPLDLAIKIGNTPNASGFFTGLYGITTDDTAETFMFGFGISHTAGPIIVQVNDDSGAQGIATSFNVSSLSAGDFLFARLGGGTSMDLYHNDTSTPVYSYGGGVGSDPDLGATARIVAGHPTWFSEFGDGTDSLLVEGALFNGGMTQGERDAIVSAGTLFGAGGATTWGSRIGGFRNRRVR